MADDDASELSPTWLAAMLRELLEERYGRGRVPGVLRISKDIGEANRGETISHTQLHNILTGKTGSISENTKVILSKFFGRRPSYFSPPQDSGRWSADSVNALAARIAKLDAAQIAAIRQVIDLVEGDGIGE
ncbi:hypothetical protein [Nocardia arthritidis]|uniref:XRE family transcriptional regulator n=1 Tax=Nocardia arthritidis TaxID=228602 RepID=A0A6G9Y9A9_9NOCA|nr:hypothetical protein [Nocardia arthritidis]QIS09855.1 hypothetical protein F5544_09775 [Nocardia arthritidis]